MKRLILVAILALAGCGGGATATERPDDPTEAPTEEPEATFDVYADAGVIRFGKSYDEDTLLIVDERVKFKSTVNEIAWSANLIRTVDATSITFVLASQSKSGSEQVILSEEHDVSNPDSDLFANAIDLAFLVDNKPGTYVMRYIESGDVLAEGAFTLVK